MIAIDPETARGLFVLSALLGLSIAKCLHIAYRLGRRHVFREYFTATLRPENSARQRL